MESGRIFFDPSRNAGNMQFFGSGAPLFRGGSVLSMEETPKRERRPFFSTAAEVLFDDEYYDEQLPEKKRRLTAEQVHSLEKSFEEENKLEPERKTQLANKLGLQPRQVAVWFQNRRARWKTKQLERDYDLLKSSYDSLLSNYESISKENDKLKAEVLGLREKWQSEEPLAGEPALTQISCQHTADGPWSLQLTGKVEDRLSVGSEGSLVLDDEGPQLLDSGDSYFPANQYHGGGEDDGSDNGSNYFEYAFPAAEQHQNEDAAPLGWSIWS